jgi:hypothetical protein
VGARLSLPPDIKPCRTQRRHQHMLATHVQIDEVHITACDPEERAGTIRRGLPCCLAHANDASHGGARNKNCRRAYRKEKKKCLSSDQCLQLSRNPFGCRQVNLSAACHPFGRCGAAWKTSVLFLYESAMAVPQCSRLQGASGLLGAAVWESWELVFISSSTYSNAAVTDKREIWVWGWKYRCAHEKRKDFKGRTARRVNRLTFSHTDICLCASLFPPKQESCC